MQKDLLMIGSLKPVFTLIRSVSSSTAGSDKKDDPLEKGFSKARKVGGRIDGKLRFLLLPELYRDPLFDKRRFRQVLLVKRILQLNFFLYSGCCSSSCIKSSCSCPSVCIVSTAFPLSTKGKELTRSASYNSSLKGCSIPSEIGKERRPPRATNMGSFIKGLRI